MKANVIVGQIVCYLFSLNAGEVESHNGKNYMIIDLSYTLLCVSTIITIWESRDVAPYGLNRSLKPIVTMATSEHFWSIDFQLHLSMFV
jgi:hypothetical protein